MQVFNSYFEVSGQLVIFEKSKLFTGAMTPNRSRNLARLSGFTLEVIPFCYLGCPIFQGQPWRAYFQSIVDRIKVKLASWKGSLLTIMGRVQLVKSIIHGMLVYSFHIYRWPQSILKLLDRWIKIFVWSGDIFTRKFVRLSGVLFVSRGIQVGWISSQQLLLIIIYYYIQCASLLKQRYFCNGNIRRHYIKSSVKQQYFLIRSLIIPSG